MNLWSNISQIIIFLQVLFSNLKVDIYNRFDFEEFIDIKKSTKAIGYWIKTTFIVSVDITELYHDKINWKRHLFGWFNVVFLILYGIFLICAISIKSIFDLVDSEFIPSTYKILCIYYIFITILITSFRFDAIMSEKNRLVTVFKSFYYLQEDIKSKHGLTDANLRKLAIFYKLLYVACFYICLPFVMGFAITYYSYVAIMCNRITFQLLTPLALFHIWLVASTVFLGATMGIGMFYYYILMFKQIDCQINEIYKQIDGFFTIKHKKKLMKLIKQHNLMALNVYKVNLIIRRSILVFFVTYVILTILPLNLYIRSNSPIEKLMCFGGIFFNLLYSSCWAFAMSTTTRVAHQPYKTIYKIIKKQNFIINSKRNFNYKWKVI